MFPEYVMVGEVDGKLLRELARTAVASSIPAGDLDPGRVYRVALDPGGATRLAYRADRARMGGISPFASPKEFLSAAGTTLPVAGLRISRVEYARATADYFRKHGSVSPRASRSDLGEYLANPELNDFGAYDWLHLGAPGWTLNLGLQTSADSDGAPRPNSKKFEALDLAGGAGTKTYDFSALDRHLPVEVSLRAKAFDVLPGEGEKALRLSEGAGPLVLLQVVLSNKGASDLRGIAVLGSSRIRSLSQGVWPGGKTASDSPLIGFRDGDEKGKGLPGGTARLFLFGKEKPSVEKVILPQAGYDIGLIGLSRTLTIPAGGIVSQLVLVTTLGGDLARTLEILRPDLLKAFDE
jgi:hypothetical protein